MNKHFKTIRYKKFITLLDNLNPLGRYGKLAQGCVFRGEATRKYKLLPGIFRDDIRKKWLASKFNKENQYSGTEWEQVCLEFSILRFFYILANTHGLPLPECPIFDCSDFEIIKKVGDLQYWFPNQSDIQNHLAVKTIAAIAQHYGTPTRLLDWSYSINVALYFAASNAVKRLSLHSASAVDNDAMVLWMLNKRLIDEVRYHRQSRWLDMPAQSGYCTAT